METGSRHYQKSVDIRLKPGTASMGEGVRRTLEKDQGTCCFLKIDQTEMAQKYSLHINYPRSCAATSTAKPPPPQKKKHSTY